MRLALWLATLVALLALPGAPAAQPALDYPNVKHLFVGETRVISILIPEDRPAGISRPEESIKFEIGWSVNHRLVAIANSTNETRLRVTPVDPPSFLPVYRSTWESKPIVRADGENETSPNSTDQASWDFPVSSDIPLGDHLLTFRLEELRNVTGNWTANATATVVHTFTVVPPVPGYLRFFTENPLRTGILVAAVAIGAGYAVHTYRRPRLRPRSKTLQAERGHKGEELPPESAAEKEVRILEAKRDDLLQQIESARTRMDRGEITAFQFQDLETKRKRQVAEIEAEIARIGGGPDEE